MQRTKLMPMGTQPERSGRGCRIEVSLEISASSRLQLGSQWFWLIFPGLSMHEPRRSTTILECSLQALISRLLSTSSSTHLHRSHGYGVDKVDLTHFSELHLTAPPPNIYQPSAVFTSLLYNASYSYRMEAFQTRRCGDRSTWSPRYHDLWATAAMCPFN